MKWNDTQGGPLALTYNEHIYTCNLPHEHAHTHWGLNVVAMTKIGEFRG